MPARADLLCNGHCKSVPALSAGRFFNDYLNFTYINIF